MTVTTFWTEPNGLERRWLRRYTSGSAGWSCAEGWHHAKTFLDDVEGDSASGDSWPHDDDRWPTHCELGCGYTFTDDDVWQLFTSHIYVRPDTGETWPQRELPPGAMYDDAWLPDSFGRGGDGITLQVVLPDGFVWHVDGEASNCTRKGDHSHRCWVRHGDARTGRITVDKSGETCAAGAGSIATPKYHGFLRDGELRPVLTELVIESSADLFAPYTDADTEMVRGVFTADEIAEMLRMCLAEVEVYELAGTIEVVDAHVQFDSCDNCPEAGDDFGACPRSCVYHRAFGLIRHQARAVALDVESDGSR